MAPRASLPALALALATTAAAKDLDPQYYAADWEGTCATGKTQSPINIVSAAISPLPVELATEFAMPVAEGVVVLNVGNVAQVEWETLADPSSLPSLPAGGNGIADVLKGGVPVEKSVKVQPIQFHFHAPSEHMVDGYLTAAEVHIVSAVAEGEAPEWGCDEVWAGGDANLEQCIAVFGVMYKLGDTSPEYLDEFFDTAPVKYDETAEEAPTAPAPDSTFDLNSLLPASLDYYTYLGSLTTPDCNEGLRWTVFKEAHTITAETMQKMYDWVASVTTSDGTKTNGYRANNRIPQPINDRTVWEYSAADGMADMTDGGSAGGYGGDGAYGGECPPCPEC